MVFVGREGALGTMSVPSLPRGGSCGSALFCHLLPGELTRGLLSGGEGWVQSRMEGWAAAFAVVLSSLSLSAWAVCEQEARVGSVETGL